ncbi:MAG: uroporphyrinogen-III C-methyltransferase [Gordonia polyisoprenivorans]|nr:uroporphyrinogen-III C-methyltransferase [Gordonia polyisoprenivorans]
MPDTTPPRTPSTPYDGRIRLHPQGRRVVIVGAGPAAAAAAATLLDADAEVRVIADPATQLTAALADLAARGRIQLVAAPYQQAHLLDAWLVFPRTGTPELDTQVAADADALHIWTVDAEPTRHTTPTHGRVTIVGGGPGDPNLITVRGRQALHEADVVIHDRLAPLALLSELPATTLLIDAAKIPGGRTMPQSQINAHLTEHALAGKHVVRLKGGDPFVFGRGLEEVAACRAAGIPVEVVPGVSSAISVPGLAGISLTHRGAAHAFTVVSGHLAPSSDRSRTDWTALARSGATLVLLMAVETLPDIVATLLKAGMDPHTPAACIQDGSTSRQQIVSTTLTDLPADASGIRPPAVTVIGDVVAYTEEMNRRQAHRETVSMS